MKLSVATLLFLIAGSISNLVYASGYPADYPLFSDNKQDGPVSVRRTMQGNGAVALDVTYDSRPSGQLSNQISSYIIVHYNDGDRTGLFPMSRRGDSSVVRITNGCLEGRMGGCQTYGTPSMNHLLYWATRMPMTLNALCLEIAFVDDKGSWDSRNGANYKFCFPEHQLY